jgi:hypothetical protein
VHLPLFILPLYGGCEGEVIQQVPVSVSLTIKVNRILMGGDSSGKLLHGKSENQAFFRYGAQYKHPAIIDFVCT